MTNDVAFRKSVRIIATGSMMVIRMRLLAVVAVCMALATNALQSCTNPPNDEVIASQFHGEQMAFEQLRDVLVKDDKISEVATWGFRTFGSPLVQHPPTAEMTVAHYNEYVRLLSKVNAKAVARSPGLQPEISILVWGAGWAGDSRHIAVSSFPDNVSGDTLLGSASSAIAQRVKYTHIEGSWYIARDF